MHPAARLSIEGRKRVADALEAPGGVRERPASPGDWPRRIADVVDELGLQPWKPPESLDPLEEDEANLVVWLGFMEPET